MDQERNFRILPEARVPDNRKRIVGFSDRVSVLVTGALDRIRNSIFLVFERSRDGRFSNLRNS